jgi:hypothetical protein
MWKEGEQFDTDPTVKSIAEPAEDVGVVLLEASNPAFEQQQK